jgi:myo-inositol-1(or 4)-monophosphatase
MTLTDGDRSRLLSVMIECGERVHEALLAAEFHRLAEIVGMGADGEHTTGIDQVAEIAAIECLERASPRMNILSEEAGYIDRNASLTAVVDPIDATNNATSLPSFHHPERRDLSERIATPEQARHLFGYPYFAFSIGIFEDDVPIAGSVRNLPTGEVFTALRGRGVELDGVPVRGSGRTTIEGARIGFIRPETPTALRAIEPLLVGLRTRVRIAGCSALDLALIASGVLDAVINPNRISPAGFGEKLVDYAGGLVLLGEMGGVITHHDGSPIPTAFDLSTRAPLLAATTPELHRELRAMLDRVEWNPEDL